LAIEWGEGKGRGQLFRRDWSPPWARRPAPGRGAPTTAGGTDGGVATSFRLVGFVRSGTALASLYMPGT
jgi:hypothetical protein